MATTTLEELRDMVANRASVVVNESSRHTISAVDRYINDSLEEYHTLLTDAGMPQRATRTTLTTSSSETVANGYPTNERVVLPTDFGQLLEVFVTYNGVRMPLRPFDGVEVSLDSGWIDQPTGIPERYSLAREAAAGETVLRLLPPADATYTITVVYIPTFSPLTDDTSEFAFIDGTSEFVVCDAALKILERDGVQESLQFQSLAQRRDRTAERLRRHAQRMNRAGSQGMVDVRKRTRRSSGGYFA